MGKDFEAHLDAQVPATPEQVWDTVATGPGISSWFVGRTEIDGETVRTSFGEGWMPEGHVTAAQPPHRFAYRSDTGEDGRFVAYEYLIEGRAGASTVLRTVTSGFLPGDDWADEYEAMRYGTELFFHTLTQCLYWFPGRFAIPVDAFGPPVKDWPRTWQRLHHALGLDDAPRVGDPVRSTVIPDGVVSFTNPHTLAVRAPDAIYRFLRGFHGALVVAHALFTPAEPGIWPAFLESLESPDLDRLD
ncbi:SRPBCC family protein [Actinoplanes sp. CA-051413]|uniref:SRPBCC family protein n=1 Tax=Actinoplanes sp. CA-051413 TaxID=3239899 RepID=UPI003D98D4C2